MLGDGRATEREPLTEFAGGKWLPAQHFKQLATHWISQRREHTVADTVAAGHAGNYMSEIPDMSTISDALGLSASQGPIRGRSAAGKPRRHHGASLWRWQVRFAGTE
ncbi:hypothetical protein LRC484719_31480 [Mycobacterium riyadhense]